MKEMKRKELEKLSLEELKKFKETTWNSFKTDGLNKKINYIVNDAINNNLHLDKIAIKLCDKLWIYINTKISIKHIENVIIKYNDYIVYDESNLLIVPEFYWLNTVDAMYKIIVKDEKEELIEQLLGESK